MAEHEQDDRTRVHEYLHDFVTEPGGRAFRVRVWTKAEPGFDQDEQDTQRAWLQGTIDLVGDDMRLAAEQLANLPIVNAVEVRTSTGGYLIYPDWP